MTIKKMKQFREIQELREWYWGKFAHDLYRESEEELIKEGRGQLWRRFTGIFTEEVKQLQAKKFDELFEKLLKDKKK